ncbi:MAG: LPS export ABC transporter permease LptF [Rhodospirillales bacterium]|jgi:lipopolysaccharide export system permease protein|nr:LPS export ABC transporter permease LptF [Rhodospirillales bacterium]
MNELTRYVLRQLLVGMVLVTIGLTGIIWLSQSLRFVEMIVNRGVTGGMFLYLTMLLLPNFLSIILPIALFTVVVFIYSKLVTDRELVVMRASGMSQFALAKPALIMALLVVAAGYVLNIFLVPQSYRMFRELQWDIRYSYSHVLLQEGAFNTVSKDVTVYVRERAKDGQLHGILVHDGRNGAKPSTVMATRGALVESGGSSRVIMFEGNRQERDKKTNKFSILYFDRYTIELDKSEDQAAVRYREPRERTLAELFGIEKDSLMDPRNYGKFVVEAHKRLIWPLFAACFTLIGLACLISGGISRQGQSGRIALAAAIVILFVAMALGLANVSAKSLELIPLMYIGTVLPMILGYVFMLRRPWRPKGGARAGLAAQSPMR